MIASKSCLEWRMAWRRMMGWPVPLVEYETSPARVEIKGMII